MLNSLLETEDWAELLAHGVATVASPRIGKRIPARYALNFDGLDRKLHDALAEHVIVTDDVDELRRHGKTLEYLVFSVCGLPDTSANRAEDPDTGQSAASALSKAVGARLRLGYDGPVQKLLGEERAWLFSRKFHLDALQPVTYWAITRDATVVSNNIVAPQLEARLKTMKRSSVNTLTLLSRIPEAAARLIAAEEAEIVGRIATRDRIYREAVGALDPTDHRGRAALDAAIAEAKGTYTSDFAAPLKEIASSQPVVAPAETTVPPAARPGADAASGADGDEDDGTV